MALQGAEILIYPTAIGYAASDTPEEQQRQRRAWQTVMRGHAVANGLPVLAVNRVGFEPDPSGQTEGIQFWGTSFLAGPQGEIVYSTSTTRRMCGAGGRSCAIGASTPTEISSNVLSIKKQTSNKP